jgi:hypothetical protein
MSTTSTNINRKTKKTFQLKRLFLAMNIKTKWFFQLFGQEDQVITALIANSNADQHL